MTARFKKISFGVVSVILLIVAIFSVTSITASAEVEVDYSFYQLSSTAASYMNKTFSPSNKDSNTVVLKYDDQSTLPGNASTYVGYCDSERSGGLIYGWLMSALSSSSSTYSYATFKNDASIPNAFYAYAQYGNLLNKIGFDSTSTEGFSLMRLLSGGLMCAAYFMAMSVVGIFSIVFSVLKVLNPFLIFAGVGKVADYMGVTTNPDNPFAVLFNTVSSWYNAITDLSWWITVPIFFICLILCLLLVRTANKASKVKKYIIRIVFIAIGIPICGALYTSCLTNMSNFVEKGGTMVAPTKIIASTFLDFEAWASDSQLSPSQYSVLSMDLYNNNNDEGMVVNRTYIQLRRTCMSINAQSHAISGLKQSDIIGAPDDSNGNSLTYETTASSNYQSNRRGVSDTINLLYRYMSNDFYHASDWESQCKEKLTTTNAFDDTTKKDTEAWFKDMAKEDNWKNDADAGKYTNSNVAKDLLFDGDLQYDVSLQNGRGEYVPKSRDWGSAKGLSTLGMYNYLSTKFTGSSVVVYSNEKSSSGFVRESHHSVNLIGGTGIMSFLYYLNALTLLLAYAVVGWFYAISICMSNLKRGIRSIASVPFALLGSIPAIAKVITYTIVLIVEIMGTFFVYELVSELLFSFNNMLEGFLSAAFNNVDNLFATVSIGSQPASLVADGTIVMGLIMLAQIVFIVWFTIIAMKMRKSIVKSLDEIISKFIDRLFDVNNTALPSPKQPGMLRQGAGAVASGVGMGAGQKLGNSIMNKNAQPASTQGTVKDTKNNSKGESGLMHIGNVGGTNSSSSDVSAADGGKDTTKMLSSGGGYSDALSSGSGDAGSNVAGAITDTAFAENNQEQADKTMGERVQQFASLGGDTKEEKDRKNVIKDAEEQRNMDAAMGNTSVMADEQYDDDKRQTEKEAKKEAKVKGIKAGAQTVVGVGEIIGGAVSGEAGIAQDGIKNTVNGAGGLLDAKKDAQNAETNAAAVAMQQEQQREVMSNEQSNGADYDVQAQSDDVTQADTQDGYATQADMQDGYTSNDVTQTDVRDVASDSVQNVDGDISNVYGEDTSTINTSDVDNSATGSSQSSDTMNMTDSDSTNYTDSEQTFKSVDSNVDSGVVNNSDISDMSSAGYVSNNMTDNISNRNVDSRNTDNSSVSSSRNVSGGTPDKQVGAVYNTNNGVSKSVANSQTANSMNSKTAGSVKKTAINGNTANSSVQVAGGKTNVVNKSNAQNTAVNHSVAVANSKKNVANQNGAVTTNNTRASVANNVHKNIAPNKQNGPKSVSKPVSGKQIAAKPVPGKQIAGKQIAGSKPANNQFINKTDAVRTINNSSAPKVRQNSASVNQVSNTRSNVRPNRAVPAKNTVNNVAKGQRISNAVSNQSRVQTQQTHNVQMYNAQQRNANSATQFNNQSINRGQVQHNKNISQVNNSMQRENVTRQEIYNNTARVDNQRNNKQNNNQINVRTQTQTVSERVLKRKGASSDSDDSDWYNFL